MIPLLAYAIGQWGGYRPAAHHRMIADHLERVVSGEIKRLMIFMPPRHGKSMLASEYFPSYYLGAHPDHQVIAATYAQQLADDFGRKVRNQMQSDVYKVFFETELSQDSQSASRFHTVNGGAYFALGVGGPATGRGAHLLLIDDPIKGREDAESEVMRQHLKDWYTSVARTRLMPGGAIVVIQTRWHEDDLAGWLLKEHSHEGWTVLSLPAFAEQGDVLGRAEGDALWPECYPVEELQVIKKSVGARDFTALYQQRPSAMEGAIFKRSDWQYYKPLDLGPKAMAEAFGCNRIIQAWDTAFKAKEQSDYSVCVTVGVAGNRYYVLDVWRDRVEFPDLKRMLVAMADKWGSTSICVEDAASGQSLIQEMRRNTRLPINAIKVDRDKVTRAHAVTPTHEAQLIYIPSGGDWVADFVDECAAFPNSAHDDQVDAFCHAMTQAIASYGSMHTETPCPFGKSYANSWMA